MERTDRGVKGGQDCRRISDFSGEAEVYDAIDEIPKRGGFIDSRRASRGGGRTTCLDRKEIRGRTNLP